MTDQAGLGDLSQLLDEVKQAREAMAANHAQRAASMDELKAHIAKQDKAINALSIKLGRPNGGLELDDTRTQAIALLEVKHLLRSPKREIGTGPLFRPSEDEIAEATHAINGAKNLFRVVDQASLTYDEKKSLTSFTLGSSGFILPPEMSSTVLSCLTEVSDVASLPTTINISGSSIKFLVDNVLLDAAAWACQTDCFANNPTADLAAGLGELELRPESLRYAACVNRDLLEDASVDLEAWMLGKVNTAYCNTISNAIISGTGVGMPGGILNPNSGIPGRSIHMARRHHAQMVCPDPVSPERRVHLQSKYVCVDLDDDRCGGSSDHDRRSDAAIALSDQRQPGNHNDADARPRARCDAADVCRLQEALHPVTMLQDPFTMGYCILFRFDARVGGGVVGPSAGKLLRVR